MVIDKHEDHEHCNHIAPKVMSIQKLHHLMTTSKGSQNAFLPHKGG